MKSNSAMSTHSLRHPSRRGCFYFIEPSCVPGEELFEVIAVYNSKEREPRGKAWRKMKCMIANKHPGIYGSLE